MNVNVVCVANQKGGVGKTTTAATIASGLVARGHRTLVVDLDPQGNLAAWASEGLIGERRGACQVLRGEAGLEEVAKPTDMFDVVAPGAGLEGMDADASVEPWLLMEAIERLGEGCPWDHVVIDTRPGLGQLTKNGVYASDHVIMPTRADGMSLAGVGRLVGTMRAIEAHSRDVAFRISGIVVTLLRAGTREESEWLGEARAWAEREDIPFLGTVRLGVKVVEAQTRHMGISDYAPGSGVALDYESVVSRALEEMGVRS